MSKKPKSHIFSSSKVVHPAYMLIEDPIGYMKKSLRKNKKTYTTFLRGLLHRKIRGVDPVAISLHKQAIKKIDCLDCANCCKTMSPTYNKTDVKRISKHLGMTFKQYYDKYLELDDSGDYMNRMVPCQFLRKDNKCGIYEVRPRDCGGFPHTQYRDFKLYVSGTHIQNIEYCPITHNVVERMHEIVIERKLKNLKTKDTLEISSSKS